MNFHMHKLPFGGLILQKKTREEIREELLEFVAEELMESPDSLLIFAEAAIKEMPWASIKEKYFNVLPYSFFFLEGLWDYGMYDEIVVNVQAMLMNLGCKKLREKKGHYKKGEVMLAILFPYKELVGGERTAEDLGFTKEDSSAASRLYKISELFGVVDTWPETRELPLLKKVEVVTEMVNKLISTC